MPSRPGLEGSRPLGAEHECVGPGTGVDESRGRRRNEEARPVGDHAEAAQGHGEPLLIDHRPQGQRRRPIPHRCGQGKAEFMRGYTRVECATPVELEVAIPRLALAVPLGGRRGPNGPVSPVWHAWSFTNAGRAYSSYLVARAVTGSSWCTSFARRRRCGLYQATGGCTAPPDAGPFEPDRRQEGWRIGMRNGAGDPKWRTEAKAVDQCCGFGSGRATGMNKC